MPDGVEWGVTWGVLTAALVSLVHVLPVRLKAVSRRPNPWWLWCLLRGEWGVLGTLRLGVCLMGAGGWYWATGWSLPPAVQDTVMTAVWVVVSVALFNACLASALPLGKTVLVCGVLALGGMVWWSVIVNTRFF